MPTRDELNLIGKNAQLTSKSCDSVGVQIRNSRNTVAFKTPGVVKKPPFWFVEQARLYQPTRQLNHLARLLHTGIAVAVAIPADSFTCESQQNS